MQIVKRACKYIRQAIMALMVVMLLMGFISYVPYLTVIMTIYIVICTIANGIYLAIPEEKE